MNMYLENILDDRRLSGTRAHKHHFLGLVENGECESHT